MGKKVTLKWGKKAAIDIEPGTDLDIEGIQNHLRQYGIPSSIKAGDFDVNEELEIAATGYSGLIRKFSGDPEVFHSVRVLCRVAADDRVKPDIYSSVYDAALLHDYTANTGVEIGEVHSAIATVRLIRELAKLRLSGSDRANMLTRLAGASWNARLILLHSCQDNLWELSKFAADMEQDNSVSKKVRKKAKELLKLYEEDSYMLAEALGETVAVAAVV